MSSLDTKYTNTQTIDVNAGLLRRQRERLEHKIRPNGISIPLPVRAISIEILLSRLECVKLLKLTVSILPRGLSIDIGGLNVV